MKCNLWDINQEDTCGYCIHAKRMTDGESVICKKKNNIYPFDFSCKKFNFDILKKNLKRQKKPDFSKFKQSDFEL